MSELWPRTPEQSGSAAHDAALVDAARREVEAAATVPPEDEQPPSRIVSADETLEWPTR